jgi:hypothetical protein
MVAFPDPLASQYDLGMSEQPRYGINWGVVAALVLLVRATVLAWLIMPAVQS